MDEREDFNECYEVALNRFFVFISTGKKSFISFAVLLAIAIVLAVMRPDGDFNVLPITVVFYFVIFSIVKYFSYPKFFDVTPAWIRIKFKNSIYNILFKRRYTVEADGDKEYFINDIEYIRFKQTQFEKQLNIGSIEIYGKTLLSTSPMNVAPEPKIFTIYGVKNFAKVSKWLLEYVETKEKQEKETVNH